MHENSGHCQSCLNIFDLYPGFYQPLKGWFLDLQLKVPEAHISCAGRGKIEQEVLYQRGATRAKYGESAHNFNAAIDVFALIDGKYDLSKPWFLFNIKPRLTSELIWYGQPNASFYELPHIEVKGYKSKGSLVEPL